MDEFQVIHYTLWTQKGFYWVADVTKYKSENLKSRSWKKLITSLIKMASLIYHYCQQFGAIPSSYRKLQERSKFLSPNLAIWLIISLLPVWIPVNHPCLCLPLCLSCCYKPIYSTETHWKWNIWKRLCGCYNKKYIISLWPVGFLSLQGSTIEPVLDAIRFGDKSV